VLSSSPTGTTPSVIGPGMCSLPNYGLSFTANEARNL
jgi:hypothetical protein